MKNSKQAMKRVNFDVIRYRFAEKQTCIRIVVLSYCRKSSLLYGFAAEMLCISIFAWKYRHIDVINCRCDDAIYYRRNDVQNYRCYDLPKQKSKSMIEWWFTEIYHYLFTSLKNCINE